MMRAPIPMGSDISQPPAKIEAMCMVTKSIRVRDVFGLRKTATNEMTPNTTITSMMTAARIARLFIAEE
jgi:hypothetical protein